MSPPLRQGLLWGISAGLFSAACYMSFDFVGGLLFGPLLALTAGTAAAYCAIGQTARQKPIRTGAMAGAIVGVMIVISLMIFAVILVIVALNEPSAHVVQAELAPSFATLGLDPAGTPLWLVGAALFISFCFGSINAMIAAFFGVVSGWVVARQSRSTGQSRR
jgi:hypothetical protein